MDWFDFDFCFDLNDDELTISEYTSNTNRRLLQTEYQIDAGFEYNDVLQDMLFGNDTVFDIDEFGSIFGDELIDILIEENALNVNTTDIGITVFEPEQDTESESDHKVEGSLINAVVIMATIDVLIFIFCTIYVVKNTRFRADEEGDIDWKEAIKKYKIPYWVGCVEILDSLIHWIFAIIVITLPSYLGWILFCLLLAAEIILYGRYILYKQLILYQIPKLRNDTKISETELKEGIIARRTDVGIFGVALGMIEDLPVIIIVIIVGENFGYNAIEVIALLAALISLSMKIGLLGNAMFSSTDNGPIAANNNKDEKATNKAIELAEDKNEEKEKLKNTNDIEEEEKEEPADKNDDADGGDKKTEEEKPLNTENKDGDDKKTEEEKPLNTENKGDDDKKTEEEKPINTKNDGDAGADGDDKKTEEEKPINTENDGGDAGDDTKTEEEKPLNTENKDKTEDYHE